MKCILDIHFHTDPFIFPTLKFWSTFHLFEIPVWLSFTFVKYPHLIRDRKLLYMMKRLVAEGFVPFVVSSLWTSHSRRD